ncbi:MAG: hypothetical protein ACI4YB_00670 [Oscillospiraceae bacterium]
MSRKNELIWGICLIVISVVTLIISISNIIGAELPDILIRILGITDLCILPVFIYTSVKKFDRKNND